MTFTIEFPSKGMVHVRTYGIASAQGLKDLLVAVLDEQEWIPGSSLLIDHRKLNFSELTLEDVMSFQRFTKEQCARIGASRIASVMLDVFGKALSQMWSRPFQAEVTFTHKEFTSEHEAREWLESPRSKS